MTPTDVSERDQIMARLAQSRAEISHLLEPQPDVGEGEEHGRPSHAGAGFPRSKTMQALMTGRGLGAMGAVAGGLLLARPGLAWRVLRLLPTSAVTRMIVAKVVGAMGSKR